MQMLLPPQLTPALLHSHEAGWGFSAMVFLLLGLFLFRFTNTAVVHPELGVMFVVYPVTPAVISSPSSPMLDIRKTAVVTNLKHGTM